MTDEGIFDCIALCQGTLAKEASQRVLDAHAAKMAKEAEDRKARKAAPTK